MKTSIAVITLLASMCSFGYVTTFNLKCGTNETDRIKVPGGSARIVAFETAMTDASETGTASLSIGRTIVGDLVHADIESHSTTSVVAIADTLVNNYDITATFGSDGSKYWVQSSTFSNCYANTTKTGTYADTNKTSRIVFRPGSGNKTLVPPTEFYIGLTFFEDNRWSTNFTWEADQSEIVLSSGSGLPSYAVTLRRPLPPLTKMRIDTNVVTTVTTNVWKEKASRTVVIPVIGPTQIANGYLMAVPTTNTYVFAGDKLICTAPIETNKPGVVRAILEP